MWWLGGKVGSPLGASCLSKRLVEWFPPLLFLGVLFFWPLGNILSRGFQGDWVFHLLNLRDWQITWFTVWQAAVSTALTIGLAIPAAYIMYRKRFAGQRALRSLITIPFMLPTIVVATGFTIFRDAGHLWSNPIIWIIAAHVFLNYALAVRTIGTFWMSLDLHTEEAAALSGAGRLRTVWSISLPQLKPAIISAAASTFLYCSASYGVILVLGGGQVHSLETEIASAANTLLDLPKASALALIQSMLSVIAFGITQTGGRANIGIEIGEHDGDVKNLDKRDWFASLLTFPIIAVLVVAPMSLIVFKTFTEGSGFVGNFVNLTGRGARNLLNLSVLDSMGNSVRNMLISAAIAMVIGVMVSYLLAIPTKNFRQTLVNRVLDVAFLLPLGISTVVLGFGYLVTFGGYPLPLRETWLVTPLIQSVMSVPIVIRLVYPALVSVERSHFEAAATAGASRWQIWWFIELPMIRFSVYTATAFAALVSLGEFGAASLLAYGDQATLPTVLYSLISKPGGQNYGMAMAAATLIIVLTFAVVFVISRENLQEREPKRNGLA
jgi:thiamine transport system permease protein